ncbi:MAG TPA: hypothetical protein VNT79_03500 [Phycisphaerae bacterium]|nr:hypothetical protein [Phycisphaerae bacterium]
MTSLLIFAATQATFLAPASVDSLMTAIRTVETNGRSDVVGDGGRAIGPYQIHYGYWKDSGVKGRWEQCRNRPYAERVMRAYWRRYCPKALASGDWRTLARVHNGGPRGHLRGTTYKYWSRVCAKLKRPSAKQQGKLRTAPKPRKEPRRGK